MAQTDESLSLAQWMNEVGEETFRKRFNISKMTVFYWKIGNHLPPPKYLAKIHKLSEGRVCIKKLILDFYQ